MTLLNELFGFLHHLKDLISPFCVNLSLRDTFSASVLYLFQTCQLLFLFLFISLRSFSIFTIFYVDLYSNTHTYDNEIFIIISIYALFGNYLKLQSSFNNCTHFDKFKIK